MKTITIKNMSGITKTYSGQTISNDETYMLSDDEHITFRHDNILYFDVASGLTQIGDGTSYFTDGLAGWTWLTNDITEVELTQRSDSQGNKIAAHVSAKPIINGKAFYATWTGAGDHVTTGQIAGGDKLTFSFDAGINQVTRVMRFHENNGDAYLFDGYIKWHGATVNDWIDVDICADGTALQQVANLDLIINGDWIEYVGPGAGTHGFAATPILLPRSYSKDGEWDYSPSTGLIPNFTSTGGFKISTEIKTVHTFINNMPLLDAASDYMKFWSQESTLLPQGYYMDMRVNCPDGDGDLELSATILMYRERTTSCS